MGDQEHTHQPAQEERPIEVDGVPEEEELSVADAADRLDVEPDQQLNRPDQPDFDEAERRQYEDPPLDRPLSEPHQPEDR
ncbi:hypothetical protein [Nocardioides conyzicola]